MKAKLIIALTTVVLYSSFVNTNFLQLLEEKLKPEIDELEVKLVDSRINLNLKTKENRIYFQNSFPFENIIQQDLFKLFDDISEVHSFI